MGKRSGNLDVKKIWMLSILLMFVGCEDEFSEKKNLVRGEFTLDKEVNWDKDGAQMVLITTGLLGSFKMGDHHDNMSDALPLHSVVLDDFYMDAKEVTVGQFKQFVNQSGYQYDGNWDDVTKYSPSNKYPMIYVHWNDATAYAEWAGKRLPTESEWEYAARGGYAGKHYKRYPWGDEIDKKKAHYNSLNEGDKTTKAVGSYEGNDYGLYDMAGNVMEWCADWYGFDYYNKSPVRNPSGPDSGSRRVLRGGSWLYDASDLRVADRNDASPNTRNSFIGFRCVASMK